MMKKKVWLVLLAMVLVSGLVMFGCGGGGDTEDPDFTPFSFEGPWDGIIKPYGNDAPVISGNEVTITAGSSTGFSIDYAAIGYTYNSKDTFIFTYEIEVTTPYAVISLKDPKNWAGNLPDTTNAKWGRGGGAEYVLGDTTRSNYEGPLVSGTWNGTIGTFEVQMSLLKGSTGIGFQHNVWADDNGDGNKIAENSKYKITLKKIENGVSDIVVEPDLTPEEQEAAFAAAVGIKELTTGDSADTAVLKIDTTTGIISRDAEATGYGSWISVAIPAASLPVVASDTIKITYIAVGNAPLTPKMPDSTADINISNKYPTFTGNGKAQTYEIPAAAYGATMPTVVSFQSRPTGDTPWSWKLKVISIEVVHGSAIVVPLAIPTVRAPVGTGTPVTVVNTDAYTGAVVWTPTATTTFTQGTSYSAAITLTKRAGYTFAGIAANSFTVTGATAVTNIAGTAEATTMTVNATFPAAPAPEEFSVTGLTADLVKGVSADVTIDSVTKYTLSATAGSYDGTFAHVKVTFPSGKTLSNYNAISFTMITISGTGNNIQYKPVLVNAFATVPTATTENTSSPNAIAIQPRAAAGTGVDAHGTYPKNLPITVASSVDLNEVYLVISCRPDGAPYSYSVQDIKFIKN